MAYLEELLPEFRKGARIRKKTWSKDKYVFHDSTNNSVIDEKNNYTSFAPDDFKTNNWEFYFELVDWQYVINNECPCWFWDNYKNQKVIGFLREIDNESKFPFRISLYNSYFKNCYPVRKDEVTFYEDI